MEVKSFDNPGFPWSKYAKRRKYLQKVLDPLGNDRKNARLDRESKEYILQQWTPHKEDRVLDFGCGVGRISEWLAPKVGYILAIDTEPEMIREATKLQRSQNVEYRCMRLDEIDDKFDVILAVFVLYRATPEERQNVLDIFQTIGKKIIIIDAR